MSHSLPFSFSVLICAGTLGCSIGASAPAYAQVKKPVAGKDQGSKSGSWNSGLSDMMNKLESQVGPGTKPGEEPDRIVPAKLVPEDRIKSTAPQAVSPSDPAAGDSTKTSIQDAKAEESADNYFDEIKKTGLIRWNEKQVPVKVFVEPASSVAHFRPEFASILKQAFQEWGKVAPEKISFQFVDEQESAQIVCTWTENRGDLLSVKEGGNTIMVPTSDGLMRADMKILTLPPDSMKTLPGNYIKRVALHEVGHAMGLTGHSDDPKDVMYATVNINDEPSALTARDRSTLIALYSYQGDTGKFDTSKLVQGDANNPKVQAMNLNNQAGEAMQQNKYEIALAKLEKAHQADPQNTLISSNLGAMYSNFGAMAGMSMKFAVAESYFKKAIPLLEQGSNKLALKQVLTNYVQILRLTNNAKELARIQAKLTQLK